MSVVTIAAAHAFRVGEANPDVPIVDPVDWTRTLADQVGLDDTSFSPVLNGGSGGTDPVTWIRDATDTIGLGETVQPVRIDGGSGGTGPITGTVKIMPLGDSITEYDISYRYPLWQKLVDSDGRAIDYVGSVTKGPSSLPDKNQEGHAGWWAKGPTSNGTGNLYDNIVGWLNTYDPQVVVLMIGTNDLLRGKSGSQTGSDIADLVNRMYSTKPQLRLVQCTVTYGWIDGSWNSADLQACNSAIRSMVTSMRNAGRNISLADMQGVDGPPGSDTYFGDGIHPTAAGAQKMADVIYPRVVEVINRSLETGGTGPAPPTVTSQEFTDVDMVALRSAETPPAGGGFAVGLPKQHVFNDFAESRRDVRYAPLHPNTVALVNNIATDQLNAGAASFNVRSYGHPVYVVPDDQPLVAVGFRDEQKFGYTKGGCFDSGEHFLMVPIPPGVQPAVGTDSSITVWQPSRDRMWEFWLAKHDYTKTLGGVTADAAAAGDYSYKTGITYWPGWSASHGGRIDNVSQSLGTFPFPMGVTATGVAAASTAVSVADVRSGSIDHALSLQLFQPRAGGQSYPATRNDGWGSSSNTSIPYEGQRFRLKASVNVDALNLTPIAKMIAKAAQKYGFIVTDKAGVLAVPGEEGSAYKLVEGSDPWDTLLGGKAYWQILQGFPWDQLEALVWDYGRPGHTSLRSPDPVRYLDRFERQDRRGVAGGGIVAVNNGGVFRTIGGALALDNAWRAQGVMPVQTATLSQWAELDVTQLAATSTSHPQLNMRLSIADDDTSQSYWMRYDPADGRWIIASNPDGTSAVRDFAAGPAPQAPYTLRGETIALDDGTVRVRVLADGVERLSWVDSNPPRPGYAVAVQLAYGVAADRGGTRVGRVEYGDLV